MLVKLQRPPPEIRIFLPARLARSITATLRPRLPASAAHISPAAPAPRTRTSNLCVTPAFRALSLGVSHASSARSVATALRHPHLSVVDGHANVIHIVGKVGGRKPVRRRIHSKRGILRRNNLRSIRLLCAAAAVIGLLTLLGGSLAVSAEDQQGANAAPAGGPVDLAVGKQ